MYINKDDWLYLSLVRGLPDSTHSNGYFDVNSVFYTFSKNCGTTWEPITLLDRSGNCPARTTSIIVDHQNRIHIVWTKQYNKWFLTQGLLHSFSEDGRNWSVFPKVLTRLSTENCLEQKLICDSNGHIHLVWWQLSNMQDWKSMKIYSASFNDNEWSKPKKLFSCAKQPQLAIDEQGFLHLAWLGLAKDGSQQVFYSRSRTSIGYKKY